MTTIRQGNWNSWPIEVRKVLRSLTWRGDSGLLAQIHKAEGDWEHKTFVLFESGKPIAWAMACWDQQFAEFDIMLYVRRDRRRMGYGTRLFNKARTWVKGKGVPYFFFPEPTNMPFFKKVAPEKF